MRIRPSLLVLALLLGSGLRAQGPDASAVASGLQAWLDGTRDLRCRFEQTLVSHALGSNRPESGTMLLLRPGRMRWDYGQPDPKIALLEGGRTAVYLPGERQVLRGTLAGESGGALHALLAGTGRIEELFVPTLLDPQGAGSSRYRLRLVPRTRNESFESVEIDVVPPTFAIEAARVIDPSGSVLLYRFSALKRNRGLSEAAFHFEPPPGTEIVDTP